MGATDFAVHTRVTCATCVNRKKCKCNKCKGQSMLCKLGSIFFPMMGGCKWNSILVCPQYKKGE